MIFLIKALYLKKANNFISKSKIADSYGDFLNYIFEISYTFSNWLSFCYNMHCSFFIKHVLFFFWFA